MRDEKKQEGGVSLMSRLKDLKKQLAFQNVKQPKELKSFRKNIIIRTIVVDFLFAIFAFSLKGAQLAFQNDLTWVALLLAGIYFSERIVRTAYHTYSEYREDNFREIYATYITDIIMSIINKTRGKVFKDEKDGIQTVMELPELLKKSKDYIEGVWQFWWIIPLVISRSVTLLVMGVFTCKMELISGSTNDTIFLMTLLILCAIAYFYFGRKRIKVMDAYRKKKKENEAREEVLFSEVKTIEFASDRDFTYHADRLRKQMIESIKLLKVERLNMNRVFIKRSAVASGFMLIILGYKFFTSGAVNEEVFLGIVAISTVYSTILEKISEIIDNFEKLWNYVIEISTLYADFSKIDEAYWIEQEKQNKRTESAQKSYTETCKIQVGDLIFTYDARNTWHLTNPNPFELLLGEVALIKGETGSGKTTFLNVLNGNVRMAETPIRFSNGEVGYLNTLTYHTDRAMANNYILNEIILSDDCSIVDKQKLFDILEGLELKHLFLTFAKNDGALKEIEDEDELLIGFLKTRKYKQFSSGQQQRIALAKLLYTLDDSIQAILLDEAFNRLNDEIADSCAKFILEYVQHDRKRMVLLATHQLSIIRKYCTKEISFEIGSDGSSTIDIIQL